MCFGLTLNIIALKFMFVNMFLMFVDNFFVLDIKIALAPLGNEGVFLLYELFRYYRGITLATISAMQLMTNRIIPTFI